MIQFDGPNGLTLVSGLSFLQTIIIFSSLSHMEQKSVKFLTSCASYLSRERNKTDLRPVSRQMQHPKLWSFDWKLDLADNEKY